jgi:hypothetical protein
VLPEPFEVLALPELLREVEQQVPWEEKLLQGRRELLQVEQIDRVGSLFQPTGISLKSQDKNTCFNAIIAS